MCDGGSRPMTPLQWNYGPIAKDALAEERGDQPDGSGRSRLLGRPWRRLHPADDGRKARVAAEAVDVGIGLKLPVVFEAGRDGQFQGLDRAVEQPPSLRLLVRVPPVDGLVAVEGVGGGGKGKGAHQPPARDGGTARLLRGGGLEEVFGL